MNNVLSAHLAVVAFAAIACGGCSSEVAAPNTPTFESRVAAQPAAPVNEPTKSMVSIDERIVRACNLPTPRFAFDSARVQETADPALARIAACFTTGPLAGRSLHLVGHADPRGDVDYNFALGQRRAGNVAAYLEGHGVLSNKVTTTSRGALDAVGTDEATWALDRRVDLTLGD